MNSEIKRQLKRLQKEGENKDLLVMFQDEAGFGRISKSKSCWTPQKERLNVASHHIWQCNSAFGAVSP